jgi:phosphatidylserine/phosphatidylglycerophosphate/cardiolipin synthase-like enzyme
MAIARDLVRLEQKLRKRPTLNLFSGPDRDLLFSIPAVSDLVSQLDRIDPARAVRLCLQALRIQHAELEPKLIDAELVATLPPGTPGLARPTERVLHEMVLRAQREVIILGYELSDEPFLALLGEAVRRDVALIIICDRVRGVAARIRDAWPVGVPHPRVFQDSLRTASPVYASMHAKCVLVDADDLLITSANFTFHGLHGNIEVGVRLRGAPAGEARKIFGHLVDEGILEELDRVSLGP